MSKVVLVGAWLGVVVASGAYAANPEAGKEKSRTCAACHGADGNSPTPANPNLAGQAADYITLQLAHFKSGIRVSPIMQPMAATLSDADMRSLGAYFGVPGASDAGASGAGS